MWFIVYLLLVICIGMVFRFFFIICFINLFSFFCEEVSDKLVDECYKFRVL